MKRNLEVRSLAEKLLYDLTQLPGESSEDENRLGRALARFLTSPHFTVDALFDDYSPDFFHRAEADYTPYRTGEKK